MAKPDGAPRARVTALTRDRIVDSAIELLDAGGARGLTFRALAQRLGTGHGALQWHVANRAELLAAATETALAGALADPATDDPREAVRAVALDFFDAVDAHPWLAAQLFAVPWQPGMVRLWERIGRPIEQLGVPQDRWFTAASAILGFLVGVASQNAVNAHTLGKDGDRDGVLDTVADRWQELDEDEHPFVRRIAAQLRDHDDRAELVAGVDLILDGLTAPR